MDNNNLKYGEVLMTPSLVPFKFMKGNEGAIVTDQNNTPIKDSQILNEIEKGVKQGIYNKSSETKTEDKSVTFDIPTWSLPYIINGDADGLSDDEQEMVDDFLDKNFSDGYVPDVIEGSEKDFNNSPAFGERNPNALPQYGESPYAATETVAVRFTPFEQSVNIPLVNDEQYEYKTVVDNRSTVEKYNDNYNQLCSDLDEVKNRMSEIGGDATKRLKTNEDGSLYEKLEVLSHGYPITQGEPNLYVRLDATLSYKTGELEYNYHSFDEANRDPETGRIFSTKNVISREEWFDRLDGYIQSEGKSYEPINEAQAQSLSSSILAEMKAEREQAEVENDEEEVQERNNGYSMIR